MSQEQQKQDDEERMMRSLEVLQKVDRAGLREEALFLAAELGLTTEWRQHAR